MEFTAVDRAVAISGVKKVVGFLSSLNLWWIGMGLFTWFCGAWAHLWWRNGRRRRGPRQSLWVAGRQQRRWGYSSYFSSSSCLALGWVIHRRCRNTRLLLASHSQAHRHGNESDIANLTRHDCHCHVVNCILKFLHLKWMIDWTDSSDVWHFSVCCCTRCHCWAWEHETNRLSTSTAAWIESSRA